MVHFGPDVEPVRIGLIGCGKISAAYLRAAPDYPVLDMIACADIDHAAAERVGAEFGLQAMGVDALLARDDIEAILNLTVPGAHAPVNLAALQAGKHVYCEKAFAVDPAAGAEVLAAARERGLRVGSAPDTFLGAGHQTVRALVDAERIGRVVAASAIWMGHGHESWHPNPSFFYEPGGGPHFDMGPYYLTALVHALGPVRAVTAMTGRAFDSRTVGSGPNAGAVVPVQVNTHLSGTLEFVSGCIGTIAMSFDVWRHSHPPGAVRHRRQHLRARPERLRRPGAGGRPRRRMDRGSAGRRPPRQRAQHRSGGYVHRAALRGAASMQRGTGAACA